jgi:hypothetical protein
MLSSRGRGRGKEKEKGEGKGKENKLDQGEEGEACLGVVDRGGRWFLRFRSRLVRDPWYGIGGE